MSLFARFVSPHLQKPSSGFCGYLVKKYILDGNAPLARATFDELHAEGSDNVLELGFGYGSGLTYALDKTIRSGSGKMYGVDYSTTACDFVKKSLRSDVQKGKLQVWNADVCNMPIENGIIDKVFHINCFYFWTDMTAAAIEIKRTMKPGGLMVTGANPKKIHMAVSKGFLKESHFQPHKYMEALKQADFSGVSMDGEREDSQNIFIYAVKPTN